MTLQIELDQRTTDELEQLAIAREMAAAELAKEAIRTYLREEARHAMDAEIDAYTILHPQLVVTIPDQFAAIYQGDLVDHDADQVTLLRRIEAHYPGRTVLIRQVKPDVETTIHARSPRIEYE